MSRRLVIEIIGDDASLSRALVHANASSSRFARDIGRHMRPVRGMFNTLTASLIGGGLSGAGLVYGIEAAVDAADDLQTSLRLTQTVFGSSTTSIKTWSRTSATALGLARGEALKYSDTFGQILEHLNQTPAIAARGSKALVGLASDVAKTTPGIEVGDVVRAEVNALTGRGLALKKYGIVVTNQSVKEEAYRLGIAKTGATLSDSQKAFAVYRMLLSQVAARHAQAATQSDNFHVASMRLRAELADDEAVIGKALLPTIEKYGQELANWLGKSKNQAAVAQTVKTVMADLAGALKGVLSVVVPLAKGANAVAQQIGGWKNAAILLTGALVTLKALKFGFWIAGIASDLGALILKLTATAAAMGTIPAAAVGVEAGLAGVAGSAGAAELASAGLLASLGALGAIGLIAIPIIVTIIFRRQIEDTLNNSFSGDAANWVGKKLSFIPGMTMSVPKSIQREMDYAAQAKEHRARLRESARWLRQHGVKAQGPIRHSAHPDWTPEQWDAARAQKKSLADQKKALADLAKWTTKGLPGSSGASSGSASGVDPILAAQMRALGLDSSGAELPHGIRSLRRELGSVQSAVKGTFLDTKEHEKLFATIRKLLSGQLGALGATMRLKIQELLDGLKGQMSGFDGFDLSVADRRRRNLDRVQSERHGEQHTHHHYSPQVTTVKDEPIGRTLRRGYYQMRIASA